MTVVNVNPLYTPRELEFQLKDSGAEAIVVLENFAATVQHALPHSSVKHVVMARMGDMLGILKGTLVNLVVRHVKKMVPAYALPQATAFNDAIAAGSGMDFVKPEIVAEDVAFIQYTGGTTGVAKGAVLTHRNLIANTLQVEAWQQPMLAARAARRAPADRRRAAALSHLRADGLLLRRHPHGLGQPSDPQPARPAQSHQGAAPLQGELVPGGEHAL